MKIVHAFCTFDKRQLLLTFSAALLILALSTNFLYTANLYAISLPEKIGRLNDYGNVLTMEDQRELEDKIDQLSTRKIGLTVLISRRDPYSNPNIYASEIQTKWNLRTQTSESFAVFVQERNEWAIRLFLRPAVTNLFPSSELTKFQTTLQKKVENNEIRSAVTHLVSRVHRQAFPPPTEKKKPREKGSGGFILYLAIGIGGGLIIIVTLLWWEGRRRCPRCGSRLEKTRNFDQVTGRKTEKNCPECGYHERV
ncbi:TPM domain-containing protein [Candidatus Bipolaricaulota bacterium]|nr:TPM domain-containing protein [Candidatus Bipolaricaulota bacterium]